MLLSLAFAATLGAQPPVGSGSVETAAWVQTLGAEEILHQFTAIAYARAHRALWVAEQWQSPGKPKLTPALWRVDAADRSATQVARDAWDPESELTRIESMAEAADGRLAILAHEAAGGYALLQIGTDDRLASRWELDGGPAGHELHKVVARPDGGFLLLGHGGAGGVVLGASAEGAVALVTEIAAEDQIYLADAAPRSDGGFYLVLSIGSWTAGFVGDCHLRLASYSSEGELLATRDLQGRFGDADGLTGGGLALLFDRETSAEAQAIRLKTLDPQLQDLGEAEVLATSGFMAPESFDLLPLGGGSWLIAGARENRPWLAVVENGGILAWQRWEDRLEIAPRHEAAIGDRTAFVVSSAYGKRMKRIRVVGFELPDER